MGAGEESSPAKNSKPTTPAQETAPSYADWSTSMQAYYGAGATPPFFASTVASPTPHPYMWGPQHPMMPPYGTPVPYPALYPPAGVYAHPSMSTAPGVAPPTVDSEGKTPEPRDRAPIKKFKGTSGKAASSSGNDGGTQSGESGSGSSDGSDENTDRQGLSGSKKGSFHQMLVDATAQNSTSGQNLQTSGPSPNLNMGMDIWNQSGAGALNLRPNSSGVSQAVPTTGMMPDQWIQDEREMKRQKRKQSNRESARRSRLRKQAECEELQSRVEVLSNENQTLRDELQRLSEECDKLTSENNSIKEELTRVCGPEAVSEIEINNSKSQLQSRADEGKT